MAVNYNATLKTNRMTLVLDLVGTKDRGRIDRQFHSRSDRDRHFDAVGRHWRHRHDPDQGHAGLSIGDAGSVHNRLHGRRAVGYRWSRRAIYGG